MATWRDGPEYAPAERPTAFVEPPVQPGFGPEPDRQKVAPEPTEQPAFSPPESATPDLATLIPAALPVRDPHLAFEVVTTALTTPTAWGSAHTAPAAPPPGMPPTWSPQQPFTGTVPVAGSIPPPPSVQPRPKVNPQQFPAPGTPQWFAPPAADQRYQPAPSVGLGAVLRAVTPGVLICLVIGALLQPLSVLLLALSFALAGRIEYRSRQIRRLFWAAVSVVGLVAAWAFLTDGLYLPSALGAASNAAQVMCWLLPFALGLVVALALGKGEKRDPRP